MARRRWVWVGVCAFLAPVLVFLGAHLLGWQLGLCASRSVWLMVLSGAMLLAAVVGLALHRVARRDGRMRPAWGLIWATAAVVLVVGVTVPAWQRARVETCSIKDGALLRSIVQERRMAIEHDEPWRSLRSIMLVAVDPASHFGGPCSCHSSDEIRLGTFTLDDYVRGRVSRQDVEAALVAAGAAAPGWERFGYFVVCNDRSTLELHPSGNVILAYTMPLRCRNWQPMFAILSDNTWQPIQSAEDVEVIESAMKTASELGLAVPPDDVAGHARRLLGL